MKRAFKVFVSNTPEIVFYGTTIYDLYDRLVLKTDKDFEDLDLLLTLREREKDPEKRDILSADYTDVLLVFDFDPQDNRFSKEKLSKMLEIFSDSTVNGRLYINYPMVEANWHISGNSFDKNFLSRKVCLKDIKVYKQTVSHEGIHTRIDYYDVSTFKRIIEHQKRKLIKIIKIDKQNKERFFEQEFLEMLKDEQLAMWGKNEHCYVIGTCLFYLAETYPNALR